MNGGIRNRLRNAGKGEGNLIHMHLGLRIIIQSWTLAQNAAKESRRALSFTRSSADRDRPKKSFTSSCNAQGVQMRLRPTYHLVNNIYTCNEVYQGKRSRRRKEVERVKTFIPRLSEECQQ